jgi:hypothetical protein
MVVMTKSFTYRILIISLVILFFESPGVSFSESQQIHQVSLQPQNIDNGTILFAPMDSTITYLIDSSGSVLHTWSSNYLPGEAVIWLGNGTILRTIKVGMVIPLGSGGGVQKVKWDGTIIWDFRYNTDGHLSHHDIKVLPNGNVLMIAWETKTSDEAIAAGRNPSNIYGNKFMPDHIIEVKPTGPTTGNIVWEWHVWDHLIQDYDPSKANYGVVGNHPELVDINFVPEEGVDWMHSNSIDYNQQLDQLLLCVNYFNEIWVIDHNTTTEEAASHSGGNSGKGGDLLYRWGNPRAYRAGTFDDQKLFLPHDATWIKPGYPGGGNILIFNNGLNRPGSHYSSVDEIDTPVNASGGYYLVPGFAYGPETLTWIYTANPPTSFYSGHLSGAQRLSDGNTLICSGEPGKFFEVTPSGTMIWEYTNEFPTPLTNNVFKITFIPPEVPPALSNLECSGSLSWTKIKPGATVSGSFQVQNIGNASSRLNWMINTSSITWGTWSYTPLFGENLTPDDGQITVHVTMTAPDQGNTDFEGYLRVENRQNTDDFDLIPVSLTTPTEIQPTQFIPHHSILRFLQHQVINGDLFLLRLVSLLVFGLRDTLQAH